MTKRARRTVVLTALAIALSVLVSGCGAPGSVFDDAGRAIGRMWKQFTTGLASLVGIEVGNETLNSDIIEMDALFVEMTEHWLQLECRHCGEGTSSEPP